MSSFSTSERIEVRSALARALFVEGINDLGGTTGQAERLRTVTPHQLFFAIVSALAGAKAESLADVLRAFNYRNGVQLAYKAFYNRLAPLGFAVSVRGMCVRLVEQLRVQTLAPEAQTVHIAPDCDAERQPLPDPATLAGCLPLADRGYPNVPYFEAVQAADGAFIGRFTRSDDP